MALLLTVVTGAWAQDPDPIDLTPSADGTVWTLSTMPEYDVELEVTYYTDAELDQMAADEVIAMITAIGTVTYTPESKALIDAARTAYDALTAAQKALVTNLSTLTDAEATYATAEETAYTEGVELIMNPDGSWSLASMPGFDIELEIEYYDDAEISVNEDPQNPGVYYSTFYDSEVKYLLPENVEAYIVTTVSGDAMQLQKVAEAGQTIPAGAGVILKSSVNGFTLEVSDAEAVSVEGNRLEGSDISITTPSNCYVLSCENDLVGFYHYTAGNLNAHKAYIIYSGSNQAPRRLRFVFDQATGVENVQGENVQCTKVIENGVLYIIKNGAKYNATGQIVK